jgi:hypothetical protein
MNFKILKKKIFFFLLLVIFLNQSWAINYNTSDSMSNHALGMGNAGINTERGPYAVFYNPANIAAKDTGSVIQFFNLSYEANEGQVVETSRSGVFHLNSFSKMYSLGQANRGNLIGQRFSIYPNITIRNLSLGLLYEQNRAMLVREDDSVLIRARDRFGPTASLSFRLWGGILRFGFMAQALVLTEPLSSTGYVSGPLSSDKQTWKSNIRSGLGFSKNAGTTLSLPFRYLPSFSFVVRDIAGTSFTKSPIIFTGSDVPKPRKMSMDASVGWTLYLGNSLETKWAIDYRDITSTRGHGNRIEHIMTGMELSMNRLIHIRAGLFNAYPTAGFAIGNNINSLNFVWYSDNVEDRLRSFREQRFGFQFVKSLIGR